MKHDASASIRQTLGERGSKSNSTQLKSRIAYMKPKYGAMRERRGKQLHMQR
uniref:Mating type protein n=1 Tax=Peronospora matthiolae TaxID=2874970 RepID=A0AAV1TH13_9STRA